MCCYKYREEKKNSQTSFMAAWLQKGSVTSTKRKIADNKDEDVSNKDAEDEKKISKLRKEN